MKKPTRHTCLAAVLSFLPLAASAAPRRGESAAPPRLPAFLALPDAHNVHKPLPTDRIGLYVRASRLIEPSSPSVDPSDDPSPPQDAAGWAQRYSLKRKDAWLKRNAAGFALFDKALKAPLRPKNLYFDPTEIDLSTPAALRQLARELLADVHAREMRGDWNGAVHRRLDILQVGNDFGAGGALIDALVGIAIQAIGTFDVSGSAGRLTLPQVRAAAERLSELYRHRLRLASALEGEKKFGRRQWALTLAKPTWRDPRNFLDLSPGQRAELRTTTPATLLRAYDAEMDRQIKVAHMGYLKMAGVPAPARLVAAMAPDWTRSRFNFARTDAGNATWLVSLALQAHKLERGEYPKTLRGLVPGFLPRVPTDPFDGIAPLCYHRTKGSYLLWSIGPDGVDDGGKPIARDKTKPLRVSSPAAPLRLPRILPESKGDFVAGKNQ